MDQKKVIIYTDGACSGNPGPGGWAAVLMYNEFKKEISGFEDHTTNNRMELKAVIEALAALKFECKVDVYTDSAYVCNAFEKGWIYNWCKNGWKNSSKQPVENQDLWKELIGKVRLHDISWHKVKGHSDNEYNNKCDALARSEIKNNVSAAR